MGLSSAYLIVLLSSILASSEDRKFACLDLQPKANQKLNEGVCDLYRPTNNLDTLPRGNQTLGNFKFDIGDGLLQLGCIGSPEKPTRIEGIAVGRAFQKLHILHGAGLGNNGDDDTVIGLYVVHYQDDSK